MTINVDTKPVNAFSRTALIGALEAEKAAQNDAPIPSIEWAWVMMECSKLPPLTRLLALVIGLHSELGEPKPTRARLSKLTGMTEGMVKKHLKATGDWVEITAKGDGRGKATEYALKIPDQTLLELLAATENLSYGKNEKQERGSVEPPLEGKGVCEVPFLPVKGVCETPHLQKERITTDERKDLVPEDLRPIETEKKGLSRGEDSPIDPSETTPSEVVVIPESNPGTSSWRAPQIHAFHQQLVEAAGDALANEAGAPKLLMIPEPLRWVDEGFDIELDILPSVSAIARRARRGSVRSWNYFRDAVANHHAARTAPVAANPTTPRREELPQWKREMNIIAYGTAYPTEEMKQPMGEPAEEEPDNPLLNAPFIWRASIL